MISKKSCQLQKRFARIGYRLFATKGTAEFLRDNDLHVDLVSKVHEDGDNNILTELKQEDRLGNQYYGA